MSMNVFQKTAWVGALLLLCVACGDSIDSHEDAMEAQIDVMDEMIEILEGVTDAASAKGAIPDMEALGKRMAEIAEQVKKLPQPTMEEMQSMQSDYMTRLQDSQKKVYATLSKLSEYPELSRAMTRAMAGTK